MSDFTKELLQLQKSNVSIAEKFEGCAPMIYKQNCLYIVSAVLIEDDKVLLVREAKRECYGLLYLPAGKVKKNEKLEVCIYNNCLMQV